jgi:hypothetical protein
MTVFSVGVDRTHTTPDFRVTKGRLVLARESDAARDRVFTSLSTLLGEWFLDVDAGVPYFGPSGILGGKMQQAEAAAILRRVILSDPEADRIESMQLTEKNRALSVQAVVVFKLASGASETALIEV